MLNMSHTQIHKGTTYIERDNAICFVWMQPLFEEGLTSESRGTCGEVKEMEKLKNTHKK